MDGIHYECKLSNGGTVEIIIVKTKSGSFIGVSEDGFFIGINAKEEEEAKKLFMEVYEEYNVINVVWD